MQSSTTLTCRALVMLGCLILVPAIAIFGGSLPDYLAKYVDGGKSEEATSMPLDEAPRFMADNRVEQVGFPAVSDSGPRVPPPAGNVSVAGLTQSPPPATMSSTPTNSPATSSLSAIPAGYHAPIGEPTASGGQTPTTSSPRTLPGDVTLDAPCPAPPVPAASPAFSDIQQRLRELGATYYRLESWGNQQQLFRFQCEVALVGRPTLTQHFEATNGDPLQAMGKVLSEVEQWKSRR